MCALTHTDVMVNSMINTFFMDHLRVCRIVVSVSCQYIISHVHVLIGRHLATKVWVRMIMKGEDRNWGVCISSIPVKVLQLFTCILCVPGGSIY